MLPTWLEVAVRASPSANVALVRGHEPLLVDAAEGQEPALALTEAWLDDLGVLPGRVACTHWHPDHTGALAWLQRERGIRVAAHEHDAARLASGDPGACEAALLAQPIARYRVDEELRDGSVLQIPGGPALEVVATPGHADGHLALWAPEDRVLFSGDLLQRDDVAWLPPDPGRLDEVIASVQRLGRLEARLVVPGHGPIVDDVPACVEGTLARYERWRDDRPRWAWHGVRRLTAAQLALRGPMPRGALVAHLSGVPMLEPMAEWIGALPAEVADRAVGDLVDSGALLLLRDGRLVPAFPHEPCGPWRVEPDLGI